MKSTAVVSLFILLQVYARGEEASSCGQLPTSINPVPFLPIATHRWPWHVAIFHRINDTDSTYKCGGTLVGRNSILTTANCVSVDADKITVSLRRFLDATESSAPFLKVADVIQHPSYDPENLHDDIAIIVLSASVIFDYDVQPVCLWDTGFSEIDGDRGTVLGWGRTETGEVWNALRQSSLSVVNTTTCLTRNRDSFGRNISDKSFCAGGQNDSNVCSVDNGSSMTFRINGKFYLRGILSTTASKKNPQNEQTVCDPTQYAIFTDVAQHLPWIQSSLKATDNTDMRIGCDWSSGNNHCTVVLDGSITNGTNFRIGFGENSNTLVTVLTISGECDGIPNVFDVASKFKNLDSFVLKNISLKAVHRNRLVSFTHITKLDLSSNKISNFDGDTFYDLTNLVEHHF